MTAEPESCDQCHYQRGGVCRRLPPVVRDSGQLGGLPTACWPIVKPADWCGEFARRVKARLAKGTESYGKPLCDPTHPWVLFASGDAHMAGGINDMLDAFESLAGALTRLALVTTDGPGWAQIVNVVTGEVSYYRNDGSRDNDGYPTWTFEV